MSRLHILRTSLAVLPFMLAVVPAAQAQPQNQPPNQPQVSQTSPVPPAVAVETPDAEAMAALDRMGAALRKLKYFSIHGDVVNEHVLATGQKIQFTGTLDITAIKPNKLRMDMKSGRQERVIYYDGKAVTIFAPAKGYYASAPAPDTISEALKTANAKYDFEIPLADLFFWGEEPGLTERVKAGFYAGPAEVNGAPVRHYAYRQQNVDWQVWINNDDLPVKLVITFTDDPSLPQYTSVLTWDLAKVPDAASFDFVPPANAHRITLTETSTATQ